MPAMKGSIKEMKLQCYKSLEQQHSRPAQAPVLFVSKIKKNVFSTISSKLCWPMEKFVTLKKCQLLFLFFHVSFMSYLNILYFAA